MTPGQIPSEIARELFAALDGKQVHEQRRRRPPVLVDAAARLRELVQLLADVDAIADEQTYLLVRARLASRARAHGADTDAGLVETIEWAQVVRARQRAR